MRPARFQTDEAPQVLVGKAFGSRFADGARLRVARADAVQGRALWQSCPQALGRPLKLLSRFIKLRQLSIPGPSLSSRCDDLRESLGRDHHGSSGAAKSWVLHTKVKTWSSWGGSVGYRQSWRLIQEAEPVVLLSLSRFLLCEDDGIWLRGHPQQQRHGLYPPVWRIRVESSRPRLGCGRAAEAPEPFRPLPIPAHSGAKVQLPASAESFGQGGWVASFVALVWHPKAHAQPGLTYNDPDRKGLCKTGRLLAFYFPETSLALLGLPFFQNLQIFAVSHRGSLLSIGVVIPTSCADRRSPSLLLRSSVKCAPCQAGGRAVLEDKMRQELRLGELPGQQRLVTALMFRTTPAQMEAVQNWHLGKSFSEDSGACLRERHFSRS